MAAEIKYIENSRQRRRKGFVSRLIPSKTVLPLRCLWRKRVDRRKRLSPESRRAYMEGLRKYREKGVPILIDGKEADESQWDKIFEIHEDGSFYMGDYVLEEVRDCQEQKAADRAEQEFLGESSSGYGKRRRLKEIRFDLVYYR